METRLSAMGFALGDESPTRLEGMETNLPHGDLGLFGKSPTRLEGMETNVNFKLLRLQPYVSDPP